MQIRSAATMPTNPKAALKELYDQRQQELETGEDRYEQLSARHDSAHTVAKYGMGTLFGGLGATVASSFAKSPLLQYSGIGLTVAGLAVFCPALWVRDEAGMEAWFQRTENDALRNCQRDLAKELGIER
jgi:hypothetical protein